MTSRPAVAALRAALRRIERKCAEMRLLAPDGVQPHFWRELMGAFETQCAEALASSGAALEAPPEPCPHIRTSPEGTSYCTLAERGEAGPLPPSAKEENRAELAALCRDTAVSLVAIADILAALGRGVVPAPPPEERDNNALSVQQRSVVAQMVDVGIGDVPPLPRDSDSVSVAYRKISRALSAFDWTIGGGRATNTAFVKREDYDELLAGIDELRRVGRAVPAPQEGPQP